MNQLQTIPDCINQPPKYDDLQLLKTNQLRKIINMQEKYLKELFSKTQAARKQMDKIDVETMIDRQDEINKLTKQMNKLREQIHYYRLQTESSGDLLRPDCTQLSKSRKLLKSTEKKILQLEAQARDLHKQFVKKLNFKYRILNQKKSEKSCGNILQQQHSSSSLESQKNHSLQIKLQQKMRQLEECRQSLLTQETKAKQFRQRLPKI